MGKPTCSLTFRLEVSDGWPPVSAECLPCQPVDGGMRVLAPPLFVNELSVGDTIIVTEEDGGQVFAWSHVIRSARSVMRLLLLRGPWPESVAAKLNAAGCNTVLFTDGATLCSVDVPDTISSGELDTLTAELDPKEIAIAYPSWRHTESQE